MRARIPATGEPLTVYGHNFACVDRAQHRYSLSVAGEVFIDLLLCPGSGVRWMAVGQSFGSVRVSARGRTPEAALAALLPELERAKEQADQIRRVVNSIAKEPA